MCAVEQLLQHVRHRLEAQDSCTSVHSELQLALCDQLGSGDDIELVRRLEAVFGQQLINRYRTRIQQIVQTALPNNDYDLRPLRLQQELSP